MFTDRERQIYESPGGVKYDPLACLRTLLVATGNKVNDFLADWEGTDAVAAAVAEGELVRAARAVFAVKPFDEDGGVLDAVALETLFHFLAFVEGKDSRGPTLPTSPPSTDPRVT